MILDLRLPDMDGEDIAREVRRHGNVPILMLTAKASERDRITGLEAGADGYERTIDSHIKNLRRKIEADKRQPLIIETVTGVGYRLGITRDT